MSQHDIHPLATAIRQRRKQAGLSVREVAEIAAVSHSWLDKQERGAAVASPLRLEAVLRKLEEHTNHSALVEMHLTAADGRIHALAQMAPRLLILAADDTVTPGAAVVTLIVDGIPEIIPVRIEAQHGRRLRIAGD